MLIGKGQDEVVKHHLGIGGKNSIFIYHISDYRFVYYKSSATRRNQSVIPVSTKDFLKCQPLSVAVTLPRYSII
jgi:hypothetical protein